MKIHFNKKITLIIYSTLLFLTKTECFSADKISLQSNEKNPNSSPAPFIISLGAGVAIKTNIRKNNNQLYHGGDVIASPIPLMQISWGPVFVGQQGLTANLVGDREISGFLNLNRGGDNYYATGMRARYDSWFFGGGFKYHKLTFNFSRDISGKSHGMRTGLNYVEIYHLSENIFTRSGLSLECFNDSFADYYYGVREYESNAEHPEYHPHAYCLPGVSFFPGYKYNENFNVMSGISFKGITSQVRRSPTTTGTWLESALILGGLWRF